MESNNVPSITARHPVGVVVAERRAGPPGADEPRPVFIPGCPLPQVLSREVADTELTRREARPTHRPVKSQAYSPRKYAARPKRIERTTTVRSVVEDKENYPNDKVYDPSVYVDSSPKNFDVQFEHASSGGYNASDEERTTDSMQSSKPSMQFSQTSSHVHNIRDTEEDVMRESTHTGPPRYVLLHGEIGGTSDSTSNGDGTLRRGSKEMSTLGLRENQKSEKHDKFNVISGTDKSGRELRGDHNFEKQDKSTIACSTESESTSDVDSRLRPHYQVVDSSTSSTDTTDIEAAEHAKAIHAKRKENDTSDALKEETNAGQASRIVQVKRGSLSVRSQPHDLRHTARGGCRSVRGGSVMSRGGGARVPQRGPGSGAPAVSRATSRRQVTGEMHTFPPVM